MLGQDADFKLSFMRNFGTENFSFTANISADENKNVKDQITEAIAAYNEAVFEHYKKTVIRVDDEQDFSKSRMSPEQLAQMEQRERELEKEMIKEKYLPKKGGRK